MNAYVGVKSVYFDFNQVLPQHLCLKISNILSPKFASFHAVAICVHEVGTETSGDYLFYVSQFVILSNS